MTVQIQSEAIEPRRQTFDNLVRRFGEDRPASRYDEATADLQPTENFHYRPLYRPEFEIFDPRRTAIRMADWYVFADPRQFYYGTWTNARAGMIQGAERNLKLIEERGLFDGIGADWRALIADYLIPFRHYEWGANMNNFRICDEGYGTQITSAAAFCAADRLGIAQLISLIGMTMEGGTGAVLDAAKAKWMDAPYWQAGRRMVENSFVVEDWFELFVAQNLATDSIFHPLVFQHFENAALRHGATALPLACTFIADWWVDVSKWVDACIRVAAAESGDNRELLSRWFVTWAERAVAAAQPLAEHVLGDAGRAVLGEVRAAALGRGARLGLAVEVAV